MSDVFISHAEEDSAIAIQLGRGLEQAGYSVWCYENDSLPGISHLLQTSKAIDECKAFVLIASFHSIASHRVGKEVERAHESVKPFIPILLGISYDDLLARQRLWGAVIGTQVSISLPPGGVSVILSRIVMGLKEMGIEPRTDVSVRIVGASRLREQSGIVAGELGPLGQARTIPGNRVFVLGFKPSAKGIVGREEYALEWSGLIESGESEFLSLFGSAGIGKSTIAALIFNNLSESASGRFERFIWCHLEENAELETVLLRLVMIVTESQMLPALGPDTEAFGMLLDLLRMRLANSPTFVVFDNLENVFGAGEKAGTFADDRWPELLRAFLGGQSAVLVTSRQVPRFSESSAQFKAVDGISNDKAIELLREAGVKDEESVLKETCRLMQGHPMALSALAAAVVRKPRYRRMIARAGDIMDAIREGPDPSRNPITLFEKVIHPDRLPPEEYALVTVMPALFRPESAEMIGALRPEIGLDQVEEALDELSLRSLVRMDDGDPPLYSIHPLVNEVARTFIEDPQVLHERAYEYYLSLPWDRNSKDPSEVEHLRQAVFHAFAGKDMVRAKAVLHEPILLAQLLRRWGRFDLALPLHRQELGIARESDSDEDIMRASGLISECLNCVGSCLDALDHSEEALRIAMLIGDTGAEGIYKGQIGRIYFRMGKLADSFRLIEEALNIAISQGDRKGEGLFRGFMGMLLIAHGEFDTALKWLNEAYEIALETGDKVNDSEWLYRMGYAQYLQGNYKQAEDAFLPVLELAMERGDKIRESTLRGLSGLVYSARGEFDRALEQLEMALEVDARIGYRRHEGGLLQAMATIENTRGNHEKALELMDKALKIAVETGSKGGEAFRQGRIGEILLGMGKLDEAMERFQQSLSFSVRTGNRSNEGPWRGGIGEVYLRQGDYSAALDWLNRAFAIASEMEDQENQNEWAGKIGQVHLEQGEYGRAEEWLRKALELSVKIGDIVNERKHRLNMGRLLMTLGKPGDAIENFERAMQIAVKLGMVDGLVDRQRAELEDARTGRWKPIDPGVIHRSDP